MSTDGVLEFVSLPFGAFWTVAAEVNLVVLGPWFGGNDGTGDKNTGCRFARFKDGAEAA